MTVVPPPLSDKERRIRRQMRDDFAYYAPRCLRIRTKDMRIIPFRPNTAQQYIHGQIENQKARTGRVRVLVLKGRQQGCSTYVEGRFFWKVTHQPASQAFILTHEDAATANLFGMAERYYEHCPGLLRPSCGTANAKELAFDRLDSGYKVGTAGKKDIGRSGTIQLFHGSEVAYWPNAETHMAGVLQAVPDIDGTEVILESTSAGAQGLFHAMCKEAYAGQGEYQLIFVPWFWQAEYRKAATDFVPTAEELAYAATHGLDHEQLAWRRAKIQELRGIHIFRREYPATVEEAFRAEMPGALWLRDTLDTTRVTTKDVPEPLVRIVVAIDPASTSKETSNATGIIVAARARNGHAYVLEDVSQERAMPEVWARAAVAAFDRRNADRVVYESNQGGDMVAHTLQTVRKTLPLTDVHASKGKQARAEPVAALYTQGLVHHVGTFSALEDELCTWVPGEESPDRLDALVWALTELLLHSPTLAIPDPDALSGPSYFRGA